MDIYWKTKTLLHKREKFRYCFSHLNGINALDDNEAVLNKSYISFVLQLFFGKYWFSFNKFL